MKFLQAIALGLLSVVNQASAEEIFKVGVLLPLSGEYVNAGLPCKNGISLALEDLSASTAKQMQVILEDDMLNPKQSVSALMKLQTSENVDALITFSSGTSQAVAPITEQAKIPLIAIASDYRVSQNRKYVVNHWVRPETLVELTVQQARNLGYKKIARISAIHNATEVFADEFDKNKGEIKIVIEENFQTDARDFRSFISKLKKYPDLDAIFVNLFFGQVGIFAKQTRELGVKIPIFGEELFEDKQEVINSGGALIGQWYVQADSGSENFQARFEKRFPDSPIFTAANCYDAVSLVAKSLEKSASKEDLNKMLHGLKNYTGAAGTYSSTSDNRFTLPAVVKIVTKDGFEKFSISEK